MLVSSMLHTAELMPSAGKRTSVPGVTCDGETSLCLSRSRVYPVLGLYEVPVSHQVSQRGVFCKYINSICSYHEFLNERNGLRAEKTETDKQDVLD